MDILVRGRSPLTLPKMALTGLAACGLVGEGEDTEGEGGTEGEVGREEGGLQHPCMASPGSFPDSP